MLCIKMIGIKRPIFFFILFMVSLSIAHADDLIKTEHFEVFHKGVGKIYAEMAAKSAERSFAGIVETLGHTPQEKITIILTPDDEQFMLLTRGILPDWSVAAALRGNRIVISPLPGHKISIDRILAHEIVHCVIDNTTGEFFVPRWFHEGCAEILSGRWGIRGRMYIVWKVWRGDLLTFGEIQSVFSIGSTDATLAYDQSMLAIKHLMNKNGGKILSVIIDGMKHGRDFQDAFIIATGVLPGEFEQDYQSYIRKAFGTRTLITLIPGIWTLIMFLTVIVYFVKRYRNKRLIRTWEEMDNIGNIIDFPSDPQNKQNKW
ncbi:peptidase MA family metallohydrolase [Candidatus Latescibacterota bacterium]